MTCLPGFNCFVRPFEDGSKRFKAARVLTTGGQPMEGDDVHSRSWSLFLSILPSPIRWIGVEFVGLIHWLDHKAGLAVVDLRSSPAFAFVTFFGIATVGLTVFLFISLVGHVPEREITTVHQAASTGLSREDLERNHDWSVQDHWRVAHMFVPHRPEVHHKVVPIDTRMDPQVENRAQLNSFHASAAMNPRLGDNFDVRLEMGRPQRAEQDSRVVAEIQQDLGRGRDRQISLRHEQRSARYRTHAPRLMVQAAWASGGDCIQYSGLPAVAHNPRVPDPIDDLPRHRYRKPHVIEVPETPIVRGSPEIDYEMTLLRHASEAALFPADSRFFSVSQRSHFPLEDLVDERHHVAFSDHHWEQFDPSTREVAEQTIQYTGIGFYDSRSLPEQITSDEDLSLPGIAEVDLQVEIHAPRTVAGGQNHTSTIVISNTGRDSIRRIEVKDALDPIHTVVGADPDAAIETILSPESEYEKKFLHREVHDLNPGEGQKFSLNWIPEDGRRQFHHAQIVAHAAVAAFTEVRRAEVEQPTVLIEPDKHPALACDVNFREQVAVGDQVELEIAVRNTGDTPLHNVQVTIHVPEQLSHQEGKIVTFAAGNLPIRGQNQTILKMSATRVGEAVNQLRISSAEPIAAHGKARIQVVDRSSVKQRPVPETIRSVPLNNCCCGPVTVYRVPRDNPFP